MTRNSVVSNLQTGSRNSPGLQRTRRFTALRLHIAQNKQLANLDIWLTQHAEWNQTFPLACIKPSSTINKSRLWCTVLLDSEKHLHALLQKLQLRSELLARFCTIFSFSRITSTFSYKTCRFWSTMYNLRRCVWFLDICLNNLRLFSIYWKFSLVSLRVTYKRFRWDVEYPQISSYDECVLSTVSLLQNIFHLF